MEEKSNRKPLEHTETKESNMSSSSNTSKVKSFTPRERSTLKPQVKHKSQNQFSQPYLIPHRELKGYPVYERKVLITPKSSTSNNNNSNKDDELVKYMSKIPTYLQQKDDKGKNIQEKALNFGVLDWKSLEKWKYNERMPGKLHRKTLPSTTTSPVLMARTQPRVSSSITSPQKLTPKKVNFQESKWKELDEKPLSVIKARDEMKHRSSEEPQNIVVLVPKNIPKISISESRSPRVPHSCPLPTVNTTKTEPCKKIDSERNPSPNRRFSFSLGRISRSFSFKDNSTIPQLNPTYTTVKSGPISSETCSSTSRAKSSPLRRLLDPLMKPKNTNPTEPSLENVKNKENSRFGALLQLSFNNDLPFFKFVVDNSNDILAAGVKNIQKDDMSLMYGFYSVCEIKRKSNGWMNQGSKGKNGEFGYNTIGQMKMSNSKGCTESILYCNDSKIQEVAAIIVKKQDEEINNNNNNDNKCIVIVPGSVHGLPNQGAPSSLITRWRSGGSCDCGGWDIGCKLQILTDQDSETDHINLYRQEEKEKEKEKEKESKAMLSLKPFKNGLYSVEFSGSISLVEAFSICVAWITSGRYLSIFKGKSLLEVKRFSEFMNQVPGKYVSIPPSSPVGRS